VSEGEERARLPRTARITASEEIRALFRRGKRKRTRHLDVFVASSPVAHPRIGLVVPRHRKKVVKRNLLKRRLREIARLHVLPVLNREGVAIDLMVRARPEAYGAGFEELREELRQVTEELCSSAR
jgi:ribonuclease P protein component